MSRPDGTEDVALQAHADAWIAERLRMVIP